MTINYLNSQSLPILIELVTLQELYGSEMPLNQFEGYFNRLVEACNKMEEIERFGDNGYT